MEILRRNTILLFVRKRFFRDLRIPELGGAVELFQIILALPFMFKSEVEDGLPACIGSLPGFFFIPGIKNTYPGDLIKDPVSGERVTPFS